MVDATTSPIEQQQMPPELAQIPPFPAIALKLLALLSNDDAGFAPIVACIATDPVLCAKVMKRANASDMATYCAVTTVQQAVSALGVDRTREVSLTAATAGFASTAMSRPSLRSCWHHTLATALIASEVARQCGQRPAEAYTAGLLHDIGRIGLVAAFPNKYEKLLEAIAEQPADLAEAERSNFGVDHIQAGTWLARQWLLPEPLIEVIAHHQSARSSEVCDETMIVQVACRLANHIGFSVERTPTAESFDEIVAPLPSFVRPRLQAQLPIIKAAIAKEIAPQDESAQVERVREDEDSPHAASAESEETRGFPWKTWVVFAVLAIVAVAVAMRFLRH